MISRWLLILALASPVLALCGEPPQEAVVKAVVISYLDSSHIIVEYHEGTHRMIKVMCNACSDSTHSMADSILIAEIWDVPIGHRNLSVQMENTAEAADRGFKDVEAAVRQLDSLLVARGKKP